MKIRCLLADDNPENLNFLKAMCGQHEDLLVLGSYMDGLEFFEAQKQIKYDACFLDIDMPGLNGMDLAKLLEDVKVVFVSAHPERAIEAFEVEAVDFIPKPVQPHRFKDAMNRLRKALSIESVNHGLVFFTTSEGKTRLDTSQIIAICSPEGSIADGRDKTLILASGKKYLLKNITMGELLIDFLPEGKFLQIFRSTLINVDFPFTMQNGDSLLFSIEGDPKPLELHIGRSYFQRFKEQFPNA